MVFLFLQTINIMEQIPYSTYKIRFIDCDPLGHLTNSRYLDYMLNAREDHVNEFYNLDYEKQAQKTGCTWVAIQNQISYFKEVKYGIKVEITSKIISFSDKKVLIEILMQDPENKKVYALLWTEAIYMNLIERKSASHPKDLATMFEQVLMPVEEKDFQSRINTLRMKK